MIGESLEDFLEAVHNIAGTEWAPMEKVAARLGVKISSAFVSAGKLAAIGLITGQNQMKEIKLTATGSAVAEDVSRKHDTLKKFMKDFLCVPEEVAEEDAHNIEHVISEETLEKIVSFLKFVHEAPDEYESWFKSFKGMVCSVK